MFSSFNIIIFVLPYTKVRLMHTMTIQVYDDCGEEDDDDDYLAIHRIPFS